jgi:MFS family permease
VTRPRRRTLGYADVFIHWIALLFSTINATIQLLVPLYALYLHYSPLVIGILAALPSVANVSLRLVFGRLSDRHGEPRILRLGGLVYLAASLGFLLSTPLGLAAVIAAQLLQGVARSIFWTVAQTYVTKLPLRGGLNLGLFNGATNLGMLLGMSGAGVCAQTLGYPGAFWVVAALASGYTGLTRRITAPAGPPSDAAPRPDAGVATPARPAALGMRPGPLRLAACCSFTSGATWAMAASFYPVYLARLTYSDRSIGVMVMLLAAGMLASSFASRRIVEGGLPLERLAVLFIGATGVGMAVVPAFQDWRALAPLLFAIGFCSGGASFVYQLVVQRHSPWRARGAAMASVGLFGNLALLVLPTTIGFALTWVSLPAALTAAGLGLLALGALARLLAGDVRQRAAEPV